jgi:hypothetical protein
LCLIFEYLFLVDDVPAKIPEAIEEEGAKIDIGRNKSIVHVFMS